MCEPALKSDEEGSNLLSRFPGCKICCIVFCGGSGRGISLWWWCLLLDRSPCRSLMWWFIFELPLWVCGLQGKQRHKIINGLILYIIMINMLSVPKLSLVCVSGSVFLYSHRVEVPPVPPLSQCSRHRCTNMYCSWVHTKDRAVNKDTSSYVWGKPAEDMVFMIREVADFECHKAMEYMCMSELQVCI